jgi:transcription termination/antitermination protein NusG
MNYYALQVKTRGERDFLKLAEYMLDAEEVPPEERGSFLWPRRKLTIRKKGRMHEHLAPVFPGYLFLESPSISTAIYHVLKGVPGFYRFLESNSNITSLRGKDLELLLHFLSFGEIVDKSDVYFDENKKIRVFRGPMKGLEGNIVKVDKRKKRAKVKLEMYEQSFLIDFGFELLEAVEKPV